MLPESFLHSIENARGFDKGAFLRIHESGEQVTSIRINPAKSSIHECVTHSLERVPSDLAPEKIPWADQGYYLPVRPLFTLDPLLHAGCYYVQEASSMFLEQAIKQTIDLDQKLKVLDLCAAPGGKSTHIQSLISPESLLVSNEVIRSRVSILQENITKWGGNNVIVTQNDAKDFGALHDYFDLIVIDAPCSGSGLFRKDVEAISEWSKQNVELCGQRQKRIIADVFNSLKKGGVLIYSTCSYSIEENEDVLDWMASNFEIESLELKLEDDWKIVKTNSKVNGFSGYRFYPDKLKGEGFFIACIRKTSGEEEHYYRKKTKQEIVSTIERTVVKDWIAEVDLALVKQEDQILALPAGFDRELNELKSHLYIRQAGITLGRLLNKDFVPDHSLALSLHLNPSIVRITLNKHDALQYLRRAEVTIESSSKGWAIVEFEGHNLGWVKLLQNRANNYYPKEWRILMR